MVAPSPTDFICKNCLRDEPSFPGAVPEFQILAGRADSRRQATVLVFSMTSRRRGTAFVLHPELPRLRWIGRTKVVVLVLVGLDQGNQNVALVRTGAGLTCNWGRGGDCSRGKFIPPARFLGSTRRMVQGPLVHDWRRCQKYPYPGGRESTNTAVPCGHRLAGDCAGLVDALTDLRQVTPAAIIRAARARIGAGRHEGRKAARRWL